MSETGEPSMTEENEALARRYPMEVFKTGNTDLADEIFTADFKVHDPSSPVVQ
jgi:hypothetical protein